MTGFTTCRLSNGTSQNHRKIIHKKKITFLHEFHAKEKKNYFFVLELTDDLLDRKIEYCHELLDFIDIVDPGFSRIRGEILNELQVAMVIQTKRHFDQDKITKEAAQVGSN